jgi:Dopey, N-terminal
MQFKEIPRKVVVAKRLSQCLNPALPTGVHQRALGVYAHILGVIGVSFSCYFSQQTQVNPSAGRSTKRPVPVDIGSVPVL